LPLPDLEGENAEGLLYIRGLKTGDAAHDNRVQPHILEFVENKTYSITERRTTHNVFEIGSAGASAKGTLKNNAGEPVRYKFVPVGGNPDKIDYVVLDAGASVDVPFDGTVRVKTKEKGTDRSPTIITVDPTMNFVVAPQLQEFCATLFFDAKGEKHDKKAARKKAAPKRKASKEAEKQAARKAKKTKEKLLKRLQEKL